MRFNRSVPPCTVIPVLIYPDPSVAAAWLSAAFGFRVRLRIANHRIQMTAGDGCLTIAEGDATPNHSHVAGRQSALATSPAPRSATSIPAAIAGARSNAFAFSARSTRVKIVSRTRSGAMSVVSR